MPPVVVIGVSGAGKTMVGQALALRLGLPFCDGDDLHSAANVAKMRTGRPLDDHDRQPWLARVNAWLRDHADGGVVSCSALKRAYRNRLREGVALRFVLLDPPRAVIERRLEARREHFMPASLLDSQLATLERPGADEALTLAGADGVEATVAAIVAWLAAIGAWHHREKRE